MTYINQRKYLSRKFFGIYKPVISSLDPNAQAFITAAGITNPTQINALNQLVLDFKSIGVWTKEKALYPVLGGSASSHAVNLKQPGTFNLSFATGWTHSSNGMLPNGATYANTSFNTSLNFSSINNIGFSLYNKTSNAYTGSPNHGIIPTSTNNRIYYGPRTPTSFFHAGTESGTTYRVAINTPNKLGLIINIRRSSNDRLAFLNGILNGTNTVNDTTGILPNFNFFIAATNNDGSPLNYTNDQIIFTSLHDSLTDAEAVNKTVAVQKYQRALWRAVDMEIQVGTGATRSYYTPFSTMDNYSISGNIYLQSEVIGAAIPMLGIEMYFSGFTLPYTMTNQEIYLAHVNQSQFDSAPAVDFSDLTLSNLTLVKASFTFTAANNAWVRMNFDTPFQYNGTSNILVIWKSNKGTWTSGGGGTDTHTSTSRSMYKVGSTGQPTGNGTLTNSRSNIKFIW